MMRALATTALIAGGALFWGIGHASAQASSPVQLPAGDGTRNEVQLRAGDAVRIEIKDEPNFSGEFILGSDGELLLPTIGRVRVAARPFAEVEAELRRAYLRELVEPIIRITPLVRISVLGEVRAPGLFLIDPTYTVSDVLARAGGLTPMANGNKIMIRHPNGIVVARFRFGSPPLGTTMQSGDEIMVARRGWASEHLGILLSAGGSVAVALITAALIR
jgi:polysaccharide export outer membrane protein